ncbi:hypothetical protein ACTFIW_004066 [Dictyostelium discoideum]
MQKIASDQPTLAELIKENKHLLNKNTTNSLIIELAKATDLTVPVSSRPPPPINLTIPQKKQSLFTLNFNFNSENLTPETVNTHITTLLRDTNINDANHETKETDLEGKKSYTLFLKVTSQQLTQIMKHRETIPATQRPVTHSPFYHIITGTIKTIDPELDLENGPSTTPLRSILEKNSSFNCINESESINDIKTYSCFALVHRSINLERSSKRTHWYSYNIRPAKTREQPPHNPTKQQPIQPVQQIHEQQEQHEPHEQQHEQQHEQHEQQHKQQHEQQEQQQEQHKQQHKQQHEHQEQQHEQQHEQHEQQHEQQHEHQEQQHEQQHEQHYEPQELHEHQIQYENLEHETKQQHKHQESQQELTHNQHVNQAQTSSKQTQNPQTHPPPQRKQDQPQLKQEHLTQQNTQNQNTQPQHQIDELKRETIEKELIEQERSQKQLRKQQPKTKHNNSTPKKAPSPLNHNITPIKTYDTIEQPQTPPSLNKNQNGKRRSGVCIINHNPKKLNITPIDTLEGRAILADISSLHNPNYKPIRILALYAPASSDRERETFAQKLKIITDKHNNSSIDIITGDFNCLHESYEPFDDFIQHLAYLNNLIDTGALHNTPTFISSANKAERRLDRFYINHTLSHPNHMNTTIHNISTEISDHKPTPIIIKLQYHLPKSKIRFILQPGTCNNHINIGIINNQLNLRPKTQFHYSINHWNNIFKPSIIKAYKQLQQNQFNYHKTCKLTLLRKANNEPNKAEEHLLNYHTLCNEYKLKKTHLNNLKQNIFGHIPSKWLSSKLHQKNKSSNITSIRNKHGIVVNEPKKVAEAFNTFYNDLYQKKECCSTTHINMLKQWKITIDSSWDNLSAPFTTSEILNSIKNTNPNKAPGPDGLTNLFYITHSTTIAPILSQIINDAFDNPNTIPQSFKSVINNNQKGFIPDQFIIDNIISFNETFIQLKKANKPGIFCLFDFHKAFDSISHNSIKRTLTHIQIPTKLINLIMELLVNAQSSIMINGEPSQPFNIERGVRQGDPLSSTIFVLVIEVLAANILNDPLIKGVSLNDKNSIFIKFLQYADDSNSISPSYRELNRILHHFNNFCKSTSSKINFDKSAIIEVNPHLITDRPPLNKFNIPICNTLSSERYLGFFFNSNGLVLNLPNILKSLKSSLIAWKCSSSSIQTKKTIINTYALSKIIYHSYLETFTKDQIKEIDELITWFMSSPSPTNSINITKTINLMRKDRSIKPMHEGGWNRWDITLRQKAQKIWIYNRFLLFKQNNKCSIYMHNWIDQLENPKSSFLIEIKNIWQVFRRSYISFNNQPNHSKTNQQIHGYYSSDPNTSGKFQWSYRDINFDLHRTQAYRNYISIIMHYIWIWICKLTFDPELPETEKLIIKNQSINYEEINTKWLNTINLQYSKTALDFNSLSIKNNDSTEERNTKWKTWTNAFKSSWCCTHIDDSFPLINY